MILRFFFSFSVLSDLDFQKVKYKRNNISKTEQENDIDILTSRVDKEHAWKKTVRPF